MEQGQKDEFLVALGPLSYRVENGKPRPEGDKPTNEQYKYLPYISRLLPLLQYSQSTPISGSTASRVYYLPHPSDASSTNAWREQVYSYLANAKSGGRMSSREINEMYNLVPTWRSPGY